MPQEGEEDDGEDHDGVVHGVVGEVGAHPEVGVGEARRQAQGVRVRELPPRPPRGQRRRAPGLGAGEEVEGARRRHRVGARRRGPEEEEEVGIVPYFDMGDGRRRRRGVGSGRGRGRGGSGGRRRMGEGGGGSWGDEPY